MPPKRKGKPLSQPPADETTRAKKSKSTTSLLEELYEDCVIQEDEHLRQKLLGQAVESGAWKHIVWPTLVQLLENTDQPQEQTDWLRGSYLLATLLSWNYRRGGMTTSSSVVAIVLAQHPPTLARVLDTLCHDDPDHMERSIQYFTVVVHFLNILQAVFQPQHTSSLRHTVLAPYISCPSMLNAIPRNCRELVLKQLQTEEEEDNPSLRDKTTTARTTPPFMVQVVHRLLQLLEHTTLKDNEETTIFVHRALEFITDALSDMSSRHYLALYLKHTHFLIHCRLAMGNNTNADVPSAPSSSTTRALGLTRQLLERVQTLLQWPIVHNRVLDTVDTLAYYYQRASAFQKMCHRYYSNELPDIVFAGVGILCQPSFVRQALSGALTDSQLQDLLHKMRLIDATESFQYLYNREFLIQVIEDFLILPKDPLETLQQYPLYPTEALLWDFAKIPPSHSSLLPPSNVLSLPKLNTKFLSFTDYLSRTYELTRLESAFDIRSDIVDSLRRLHPVVRESIESSENATTTTEFAGWSRMALEVSQPMQIRKVESPLVGERDPRKVSAEFEIDLSKCANSLRAEWDSLGQFDNLFLLCVDASKMTGELAPPLREFISSQVNHHAKEGERRVPDVDDPTFPKRYGITAVRGCMVLKITDEEGNSTDDANQDTLKGTKRIFRVQLDTSQYLQDKESTLGTDVYRSLNLVIRRHGRENNFRSILETIKGLMKGRASISKVLPTWMQGMMLGTGDPSDAAYSSKEMQSFAEKTVGVPKMTSWLDFGDTFVNEEHLRECFPNHQIHFESTVDSAESCSYRIQFHGEERSSLSVQPYRTRGANAIRFTPIQVEAIRAGLNPGLSCVVGPPGTGKTDVAVQIIANLYHSFPTQRTVIITHSNAALNDIFQKVMARGDIDQRYMIRLGSGERDLQSGSSHDFTKAGRVAYSFHRRAQLLEEVQKLSESLGISTGNERGEDGSSGYTCETSAHFYEFHVKERVAVLLQGKDAGTTESEDDFPFAGYFNTNRRVHSDEAKAYGKRLLDIFDELQEYRPIELLRTQKQRTEYLLMKQAKVIAMTCTHAAIARSQLLELNFEYDNLLIEEAGQMTDIESFIPFLLQQGKAEGDVFLQSRLKRVSMFGDHNQLPPVIKNMSLARYTNVDQSLFTRFIRSGFPYIQLDRQGRARPDIADLYRWRYSGLCDLEGVTKEKAYLLANTGFVHTFQVVNVEDFDGKGESTPTPFFYQNVGEAEFAVAMFQYMVMIGYPPEKVSILTTYNGQKNLIDDIIRRRCGEGTPLAGIRPRVVSTVDQYQGQQNDIVLLSLVRTNSVGHFRDIRRLVVAVSRARLGLYVLCRSELFQNSHELRQTFDLLLKRPQKLQLVVGETYPTDRMADEQIEDSNVFEVDGVDHLGSVVYQMQNDLLSQSNTDE